jgi:hypothetical protein
MNVIEMAVEMASNTRKSARSGAYPPVERFDAVGCSHIGRPSDRADLYGLLCRKSLKVGRLPAALLRASAQIRHDHFNQINGS